ncbi:unnamed protein product [Clonostachys chloroleuca]|uniref:Uncharacterized protein n=1 Tax=Clonostachys chloroleuca TaxID=1926264 RepID=A0AA35LR11_9HYPO|nr:unnamed protein product [Clonostachys chloroleuca]
MALSTSLSSRSVLAYARQSSRTRFSGCTMMTEVRPVALPSSVQILLLTPYSPSRLLTSSASALSGATTTVVLRAFALAAAIHTSLLPLPVPATTSMSDGRPPPPDDDDDDDARSPSHDASRPLAILPIVASASRCHRRSSSRPAPPPGAGSSWAPLTPSGPCHTLPSRSLCMPAHRAGGSDNDDDSSPSSRPGSPPSTPSTPCHATLADRNPPTSATPRSTA